MSLLDSAPVSLHVSELCMCDRGAARRFLDVVAALSTAVRNPAHEALSISAVHTLQSLARRLAECPPQVPSAFQVFINAAVHGCVRAVPDFCLHRHSSRHTLP